MLLLLLNRPALEASHRFHNLLRNGASLAITSRSYADVRGKILAIRREDQSVWERRAPLSPTNVRKLVRAGVKVLVQPSNRRAYPMQAYANAGAIIQEDIGEAPVIVGVKQIPIDFLLPNKTYCFFSHTIKAQEANMPLLDAMLEKNIRLVDYEKMMDANGQRVVAFGKYAGVAGMINILHGLGLRLLALGHHTPFMHIGPAHNYRNSGMARQAVRDAGFEIAIGMLPKSIGPLTFCFTGSGNVSQGAQEIFQDLPHEYVPPDMLQKVADHGATNKIYACEVSRRDHLIRIKGGPFDAKEYDEYPSRYISVFSKKIAPYASVIINGIYWAPNSPKLITIPDAKVLIRSAQSHLPWVQTSLGSPPLPHRLLAICDISADPGGSIEFMNECTTIDNPFCLYDAEQHKDTNSFKGPGILVCSIDNMPTQLPREATDFFGDLLLPHVFDVLQSDATKPFEEHKFTNVIEGAVITSNGKLTKNFEYIQDLRNQRNLAKHRILGDYDAQTKRVLLLGAGYVSAPVVEYLTRSNDVVVHVASALRDEADTLARRFPRTEPVLLNVQERPDLLQELIGKADVVVSLLPYALHPLVAEQCIASKTNMVTASYLSPAMKELHQRAVEAGVSIVNEVGLDPGIDHLLAMECFEEVHQGGGKVKSFVSYCGGLPAPECSDNPLRYRFSWSPRGALLNTVSSGRFLKDGKVVEIPAGGALLEKAEKLDFLPGFAFEGFANRDSLDYVDHYGIPEARTVFRGTIRYAGYSDHILGLIQLGLISQEPHPCLHSGGPDITWRQFMCNLLGITDYNIFYDNLKNQLFERTGRNASRIKAIEDLGLLSEELVVKYGNPIDTISQYLAKRLALGPADRDLVVLRHEVEILWPDQRHELRGINLVCYGQSSSAGYSAMARTVGYPAAIATKMLLDGEIQRKGMVLPFIQDIYRPMLKRLKAEGIVAEENDSINQINVELVQLFLDAQSLMGSNSSLSLASKTSVKKTSKAIKDVTALADLIDALPQTHLNLCTLTQPALKNDEFIRLQKTRLRWWKSYLQQPVLLNTTGSASLDETFVEQKIEFGSPALGSEPFEVLKLYNPAVFADLQLNEETKKSLMVKFQRKSSWPCLVTSQVKLELAVCFFLTDAYFTRNKASVLSLHKALAPYAVGIVVEGSPTRMAELEDLRRLMSLEFKQSRIPVLPLNAPWTTAQCDARGMPYLIFLSDSTLEQGICGLRSRDNTLQEQVHVSNIVERLKKFLV
ncbi:alpha-aminoadipic semialdehyde synthase, mitochondrial-like [Daphnia pulicaria]|uniref:alpha-aminoadipic semialdehyde synthase, mitochondrial-like n=1 Tax=Daphnia pulicaria TaxID=35523 RepID=UPI001EEA0998|nr:alpha-aminoadipic semialdehyde synthase, mitochondrial-like [Daphnia pulicaria]